MTRVWPSEGEYEQAIQNFKSRVHDDELKEGTVELDDVLGLPLAWRGNFGILFHFKCKGNAWAVKCFTRPSEDEGERYRAISAFIRSSGLPYFVKCEFIPDVIAVKAGAGAEKYPVLKMEWVEGVDLIKYIQKHYGNSTAMLELAERWLTMIRQLRVAGVAHGDLQFGNVLMVGNEIKLVDYDGMYVPALSNKDSEERGHQNFQHPDRDRDFGPYLDNFSAWVIYVSLVCIGYDKDLWVKAGEGENEALLFVKNDFENPDSSPMFATLLKHPQVQIRELTSQFHSLVHLGTKGIPAVVEHVATSGTSYYRPLGIKPGFTLQELERARTAMSAIWGPGYYSASSGLEERAIAKLEELNEAFDKLRQIAKVPKSKPVQHSDPGLWETVRSSEGDGSWLWDDFESPPEPAYDRYAHRDVTRNITRDWLKECRSVRSSVALQTTNIGITSIAPSSLGRALVGLKSVPAVGVVLVILVLAGIGAYASEPLVRERMLNSVASSMVSVDGGGFLMGSKDISTAKPLHPVSLDPFFIGKCEVTQDQFEFIQGKNPSHFRGSGSRPVESVSWSDCKKFIEKLNNFQHNYTYRLPTEAEWEYACRAGSISDYCFGNSDDDLKKFAWYWANSGGQSRPVGSLKGNPFGLHDMYGNVTEWCEDPYQRYGVDQIESTEQTGRRILRGGSWLSYCAGDEEERACRSSYRFGAEPGYRSDTIGFRLARSPVEHDHSQLAVDKAKANTDIASEYAERGMLAEAEAMYRKVVPESFDAVRADDPQALKRILGLAAVCMKEGKKREAELLLSGVLSVAKNSPQSNECLEGLIRIADYYSATGETEKAEDLLKKVRSSAQENGSTNRTVLVESGIKLADIYNKNKRTNDAERLLVSISKTLDSETDAEKFSGEIEQRLELIKKQRLEGSWRSHSSVGEAAFKEEDYGQAEKQLQAALEEGRKLKEPKKLARSLNALAVVYHSQKKYDLAEPLYREAEGIWRGEGGSESKALGRLLKSYASLLKSTGRADEAEKLESEAGRLLGKPVML